MKLDKDDSHWNRIPATIVVWLIAALCGTIAFFGLQIFSRLDKVEHRIEANIASIAAHAEKHTGTLEMFGQINERLRSIEAQLAEIRRGGAKRSGS